MPRALMIIDPQYDFITGSLPVPQAEEKMVALANYVAQAAGKWALKIITCDFHPWNHCSFTENGGQWPRHCLAYSKGAAIWDKVLSVAHSTPGQVYILPKGQKADMEEYSIFQAASPQIAAFVKTHAIDAFDLCGIAGDICVLNTLKDGISQYGCNMFTVLKHYSPSLDGGESLAEFCQKEKICAK